jgi:predicted component of type VI protein secretion system
MKDKKVVLNPNNVPNINPDEIIRTVEESEELLQESLTNFEEIKTEMDNSIEEFVETEQALFNETVTAHVEEHARLDAQAPVIDISDQYKDEEDIKPLLN